jgi:hypothetical protein
MRKSDGFLGFFFLNFARGLPIARAKARASETEIELELEEGVRAFGHSSLRREERGGKSCGLAIWNWDWLVRMAYAYGMVYGCWSVECPALTKDLHFKFKFQHVLNEKYDVAFSFGTNSTLNPCNIMHQKRARA